VAKSETVYNTNLSIFGLALTQWLLLPWALSLSLYSQQQPLVLFSTKRIFNIISLKIHTSSKKKKKTKYYLEGQLELNVE
jgi:hypothetical protein